MARKTKKEKQIADLLTLVGGITVTWAMLERSLDLCIYSLFHDWKGKELASEIPRTALNRKVEFLRTVFAEGTLNDTLFPGMPRVIDEIETLGNHRHQVVHGAATLVFAADGASQFNRLKHDKAGLMDVQATFSPDHLIEIRNQITLLAVFIAEFADILMTHAEPDKGDKASGEGSV